MVAVVLGSETVEVTIAHDFGTRGMRADMPAKQGNGPEQSLVTQTLLYQKTVSFPIVMTS